MGESCSTHGERGGGLVKKLFGKKRDYARKRESLQLCPVQISCSSNGSLRGP